MVTWLWRQQNILMYCHSWSIVCTFRHNPQKVVRVAVSAVVTAGTKDTVEKRSSSDNEIYNHGQKSLGQYCNIHNYFSVISRFPHKTVHPFRNFLVVLLPPTLHKVETRKKILDTRVQHCLWGEGKGWTCVNWKTTQTCKVSQDFCSGLSEQEVGRKKAILRGFQACKVFFRTSD